MVIDLFHICHGADIPSISRLTEGDCILHDTEQVARFALKDIEKYFTPNSADTGVLAYRRWW